MDWSRIGAWVRNMAALAALAAIGYFGERGDDGGFIKDIWAGMKTASPPVAMVMFFLYLRENAERREAQHQCNERTIDFIKSTNLQTAASGTMATGFRHLSDAVRGAVFEARPTKRRRRRAS